MKKIYFFLLGILFYITISESCNGQQFNSDNYVTMPYGTITTIISLGQRNAALYNSFALFPKFEFALQGNLYWEDKSKNLSQHFTTSFSVKYMFYENKKKDAGVGLFLGYGKSPGYYDQAQFQDRHTNFWTALPVTFPFFNNTLSLDIMPGGLVDFDYGHNKKTAWGFSYSNRLAVYKIIPESAIVGEFYGTTGEAYSKPEYKLGVRLESNTVVAALTYGGTFDGKRAGGFELGVMIFSPPFLKL